MSNTIKTPIKLDISPMAIDFFAMVSNVFDGGAEFVDHYLGRISEGNLEVLLEKTEEIAYGWPDLRRFERGPLALVLAIRRGTDEAEVLIVGGALRIAA